MPLTFPGSWRFHPPTGGHLNTIDIPNPAVQAFLEVIQRTATQGDHQDFLEHFKGYFCPANGSVHVRSSSAGWAISDLTTEMETSASNAPLFLEAFFDACESIRLWPGNLFAPTVTMINDLCQRYDIGYELAPPDLRLRDSSGIVVDVPERPLTLAEQSLEILQRSLRRSDDLIEQGHSREAVQETLWLLETVTTAFRGLETETGTVEGRYFNHIVRELRQAHAGTTFARVLEWVVATHGYLSSPTGGGVRHGLDLRDGLELSPNEARLFCNLIRSYLSFLLAEHETLATHSSRNDAG
jgi:hypothetical protein